MYKLTRYGMKDPVACKPALLALIALLPVPFAMSQEQAVNQAEQLENIRQQIRDVESNIQSARNETDQLYRELQRNELAAANASQKLREIDGEIDRSVKSLAELNVQKTDARKALTMEREQLVMQIRAAYRIGKNDYLKLLLNQEDPAHVGRMLAYYDYFNRARTDRIQRVTVSLEEINYIEMQIQTEKDSLDQLRSVQLANLEDYTSHRNSRKQIIDRLESYIDEQDRQLQLLQRNEQELEALIIRLTGTEETLLPTFEEITPFEQLQGKLTWPVRGTLTSRFGANRKGGKLKWRGVTIAASSGDEVQAISPGKVIFADWFRNMGLMIIIDHGNGYMSLYGHNERLLKKEGDWVNAREIISRVGDTGGQQESSLYFEIRYSGNPLDPELWCRQG